MNQPTPTSPESAAHAEIANTIKAAANELPADAVRLDDPLEGMTRITARTDRDGTGIGGNSLQLSEEGGAGPDVAIGHVRLDQIVLGSNNGQQSRISGASDTYAFRSREGQGVERAMVMRRLDPRDGITRSGSTHHQDEAVTYKHEFKGRYKAQAAKHIAGLVIKQARAGTKE